MCDKRVVSIGVGSGSSGAGKTSLIEKLIPPLKRKKFKVIAVKFTKTPSACSITDDEKEILKEGKDTARFAKALAQKVFWVKSSEENLPRAVSLLNEKLSQVMDQTERVCLIIEGNSLVKAVKPDVIIFLKDKNCKLQKHSGQELQKLAHIIIDGQYSVDEIMEKVERELIKKKLMENSKDGKITCPQARAIAEELNVPYIEVGKAANELKIKICKCELGCF